MRMRRAIALAGSKILALTALTTTCWAAGAPGEMPPGSTVYERALAAGMVLGFMAKLE